MNIYLLILLWISGLGTILCAVILLFHFMQLLRTWLWVNRSTRKLATEGQRHRA